MNAKWIWDDNEIIADSYSEFYFEFDNNSNKALLKISADTNYSLYLNDKYIFNSQYQSYSDYPVIDTIKLNTNIGLNKIKIIVYYVGDPSFFTYYMDKPGLYFELYDDNNNLIKCSDESIKSARCLTYKSGTKSIISPQLGFRFFYDARNDSTTPTYKNSIVINKSTNFQNRMNKRLLMNDKVKSTTISKDKRHILVDLSKEYTGFIYFKIKAKENTKILVTFGEHIIDGKVRYIIDNRNFSFEYICKDGINTFLSNLRRFGLRYIEIYSDQDVLFSEVTLYPTVYPFKRKEYQIESELDKKIYETSIYTLECCYHEHYEDCPWREQSFYSLDSRNQILSGYYAFKNKEQVKSAIKLMLLDNREDGLLSICYPTRNTLVIPSFSLHFFTTIYEYYKYTKDKELLKEAYPKLIRIINAFIDRVKDNLLFNFKGDDYWNFYEWINGLDFPNSDTDLILNTMFIIALNNMDKISKIVGVKDNRYKELIKSMKPMINKSFYNSKKKLYYFSKDNKEYTVLGNSLAILSGVANKKKSDYIAKTLTSDKDLVKTTLSMKCFLYDSLLKVSYDYKDYILNDIRIVYKKMLDDGATTFYETELGASDFDGAGSLCHGWSAIPIYYYNILNK